MSVRFSIVKRGSLPTEVMQQDISEETGSERLRPQLECQQVVDAVEFQNGNFRLPSMLPKGEMLAALSTLQSVMLHELEKGNAVSLPGIGTFRLSLKGSIEKKDGNYRGHDVRVDSLQFRPDSILLSKIRRFEVDQVPYGRDIQTEEAEIETRLAALFAKKNVITHKDVSFAFEQTLSRGRITSLLGKLVREGRLVREGKGAQTSYRLA